MNNLILSIAIVVYNTEKYLNECVMSCVNQNASNELYEIVLIDDGSTDGSSEIMDSFASEYDNVSVIHQNNFGVSAARNKAIECCRGDYIWFVDSDDFIQTDIIGDIIACLNKYRPDRFGVDLYWFNNELTDKELELKSKNLIVSNGPRYLCGNIYRKSIIKDNSISFDSEINVEEDMLFNYDYAIYEKTFKELNKVAYFYRGREGSLTHSSKESLLDPTLKIALKMKSFMYTGYGDTVYASFKMIKCIYDYLTVIVSLPYKKYRYYFLNLKNAGLFPMNVPQSAKEKARMKNINVDLKIFDVCSTYRGLFCLWKKQIKKKINKLIDRV